MNRYSQAYFTLLSINSGIRFCSGWSECKFRTKTFPSIYDNFADWLFLRWIGISTARETENDLDFRSPLRAPEDSQFGRNDLESGLPNSLFRLACIWVLPDLVAGTGNFSNLARSLLLPDGTQKFENRARKRTIESKDYHCRKSTKFTLIFHKYQEANMILCSRVFLQCNSNFWRVRKFVLAR